jgi:hypothetical protein
MAEVDKRISLCTPRNVKGNEKGIQVECLRIDYTVSTPNAERRAAVLKSCFFISPRLLVP